MASASTSRVSTTRDARKLFKEILRPYYLRWLYFPLFPGEKPDFFEQCWQYPSWPLYGNEAAGLLSEGGLAPSFLFLPMSDWHVRMQRPQHLATALSKLGHWCFYLNPHLGRQFHKVYAQDKVHRISLLKPRLAELHLRLPREPVHHHRMLSGAEKRTLMEALRPVLEAHSKRRVVQIVGLPTWREIAKEIKSEFGYPIVYDCHDLLRGFRDMHRTIVEAENEMLRVSDLILFSSDYLRDSKLREDPALETASLMLRNAVEPGHFPRSLQAGHSRQRPMNEARVIGYVGALDDWFDVESIERAASVRPAWKFQLAGRIEFAEIRRLQRLPNVEFFGEISYERLPELLAGFDVALIPFRRTELTMAANPIKLYEYFCCGLPVVSARLPEVERFSELVYLATNPDEFVTQIQTAAMENNPELIERRREVASAENWKSRAEQLERFTANLFR